MQRVLTGQARSAPLAMKLLILSDGVMFLALLGAYAVLRTRDGDFGAMRLSVAQGITMTILLAGVSVSVEIARRGSARAASLSAAVLGAAFLAMQCVEWSALLAAGDVVGRHLAADFFYMLTGFHGAHVLGGVLFAGACAASPPTEGGQRALSLYWHFVDVVWLAIFLLIYL